MKRHKILFVFLLYSVFCSAKIYDSPAFRMPQTFIVEPISSFCGLTISSDTLIMLNIDEQISGLSISGSCSLKNEESIVRVLLYDKEGKEYLVLEDFYLFPEEGIHNFSSVAHETAILENVNPYCIKVFVRNAMIVISQISVAPSKRQFSTKKLPEQRTAKIAAQEKYLIDRWNTYNTQSEQYWIAGQTSISGISYSDKKIVLGATSDHYLSDGIEYYTGGFFVLKAHGYSERFVNEDNHSLHDTRNATTMYVDSFDWRSRHGKNWMTSVKNQKEPDNSTSGNGGCWLFGAVAALESHVNLYYNQTLNLDLAEQEVGSCVIGTPYPSLHVGGNPGQAYDYILTHGIVNEECFRFQNDSTVACGEKCDPSQYTVNITNHCWMSSGSNQLKEELICNGPIASGYNNGYTAHIMCLCGYGTIHAGQTLSFAPHTAHADSNVIISENSNLIGQTYWIYKNSYGPTHGDNGYANIVYENDYTRYCTEKLTYPVTVSTLTTNEIVCEDEDNDGYYFWGLGPKPSHCPVCCPDTPDGDDSNPQLAEMDSYGNFTPYVFPYPALTVSSDSTWNVNRTQCGNIIVTNNATLTITAELTMNPAAKIIVQDGGTVIVDAGSVVNTTVDVQSSSKIILRNNGTLYLKRWGDLNVHLGAEADITYGRVLLQ